MKKITLLLEANNIIDNLKPKYLPFKKKIIDMLVNDTNIPSTLSTILSAYSDNGKLTINGFDDKSLYSFWEKNYTDIDGVLVDISWFNEIPINNDILSTYQYVLISTKKAIAKVIEEINSDLAAKES